jgi:hypothetical protein
MTEALAETSPPDRPKFGSWIVLGGVLGILGYLALTGSTCAEGLIAGIAGMAAGATWTIIAARRKLRGAARSIGGIALVAVVTLALVGVGRLLAPGMIFRRAFQVSPDRAVHLKNSERFGFMDNTSLLVMDTDEVTLRRLLNGAGFGTDADAEQFLRPMADLAVTAADREQRFRNQISVGGMFADKIPFKTDLKVYQRTLEVGSTMKTKITVTWDPAEQRAYVFVAEF